jgi:fatty-acyl-CoA synthase
MEGNTKFARDAWLRALAKTAPIGEQGLTLPARLDQLAVEYGDAPALSSSESRMTYRQLRARCNQYAHWGLSRGWGRGDVIALFMANGPEYLTLWLGLTRIGVEVALINSQLAGDALLHSIAVVKPVAVIAGASVAPRLAEIRSRLAREIADMPPPVDEVSAQSSESPTLPKNGAVSLDDTALYIYTSGTTGLPKAAKVSHYRVMQWSHWFAGMLDVQPQDRMYNCLPLYHSVGGVVAACAPLVNGASVVIRPRFSASDFWRDVRDERCTLFQYIGELCRYLVNTPAQAIETEHSLRLACGNGLRPEVWTPFQSRFKVPRILEYYASTEGNFSLYNCEGEVGAIGRIPAFLASRLPVALLRCDVASGEPARNADGLCEPCATDEVGEAVGLMPDGNAQRGGRFEGYADPAATQRKILRNVFKPEDAWYRTGDLMRRDSRGFYYFVDRVGDTYRWKGENVSTAEVLSALAASRGVLDGVVYGVQVPGADGRAGTAALLVSDEFDLAQFRADVAERLPSYARPVFLRIVTSMDSTATFKPRKQELQADGFDPGRIKDPLYFDDGRAQRYVPLDGVLFAAITAGEVRA